MSSSLSFPSSLSAMTDKLASSLSLNTLPVTAIALGSFGVYVLGTWVYNLWFHPLRHIPGPWYAAMSPMWLTIEDLRFRKTLSIDALLKQYGGIVRVHPNQVAFVDQAATKIAYNKFEKSTWYKGFQTNNNDHSMTSLPAAQHAPRKRAYAPHYVPSTIALYQPEIHEFTNELMDKIRQYDGKKPFDCLVLIRRALVDILFMTTYGQRVDALKSFDIVDYKPDPCTEIVAALMAFPVRGAVKTMLPRLVWAIMERLPVKSVRDFCEADKRVAAMVIRARDQVLANDPTLKTTGEMNMEAHGDERVPLIHRLLIQSHKAKAEDRLTDADIISEGMGHTIAGVDTTDTSLSYICYLLATRPDILAKLRKEIDPLMHGEDGKRHIPDYATLLQLPYLTAFYMEAMRVYGAVPAGLERSVPPSLNGDFAIKGYKIPAGSVVYTQSWSLHHDETVYPEPYEFKPERWLNPTEEMRSHWIPYGIGVRICGGKELSHIAIRVITVAIARNFDLVLPPETTPESVAPTTAFILIPAAHKINVIFKPRID